MREDHRSNNGEETEDVTEDVSPNNGPQRTLDDIFDENNARFSPEMGVEAVMELLRGVGATTRAHIREGGDSARRDTLREALGGLERTFREARNPREQSSSNPVETKNPEGRADTQDATDRNGEGARSNQTVGFNGCAPTHAVEVVRRLGLSGRRTQGSSVPPRRLEAWEHDWGSLPNTHRAEEGRKAQKPTSGPTSASEPMPKVKPSGLPSVILPDQDGDEADSEDSSGESASSSSSSGEHVAWTEDDYKKSREESANPRAGPSNGKPHREDLAELPRASLMRPTGSRRSKGKQIVRPRANGTASHDSRRLSVPLPLDTISEKSETSSRKPSPVPAEVINSTERSDATSAPIAQAGVSTLMPAGLSPNAEAVDSDTGNGNAVGLPGTLSSTVAGQVEGELQTSNLPSQTGNNGRTNGSRTTPNRLRKRRPTAQQPVPDTKNTTDGKPRANCRCRRMAEEMLAKVKAELKKCVRRIEASYCRRFARSGSL